VSVLSLLGRMVGGKLRQRWLVHDAGETAGEFVTEATALNHSVVWACIRLLCENISSLPLVLYRLNASGAPERAESNLLFSVLHDRPNPEFSALEFWEGVIFGLCMRGNAFAEVARRFDGSVISLTLLDPDRVSVRRTAENVREYRYADRNGVRIIPHEEMFHVRGFGPGLDLGLSPIAYGARSMGLAIAAEKSAARAFARGGRPTGFVGWKDEEKSPTPDQWGRIKELYFGEEARKDRDSDVMPLPPGMIYTSTGLTPDDAQLLESRGFDVEVLCRWFLVQPVMIGHTSKSTSFGAGLEQQNLWFLNRTLGPYLSRITDAISHQLLLPADRKSHYAEHDTRRLLQTDSLTRAKFYQALVGAPIITVNEARREENLPPKEGGDVLRTQMQNIPIAGQEPAPAAEREGAEA
jgi:HK97 family phage portal protein